MTIVLALTALLAQPQASEPTPTLDYEYYKANVQPIFLERKAGFTRCVVCHAEGGRVGFLQEMERRAEDWTEEQSRMNFEAVSRLVVPGKPLESRLLLHPLEPDAGGDEFHNGGRQFTSQEDPWFQTLAAWVLGETAR